MAKPIKLDWDLLEDAFNDKNEELVYYLDLVTGHVHLEGEDEDRGDEDEFDTRPPVPGAQAVVDHTRAYIEPPDTATKVGWFQGFLDVHDSDPEIVAALRKATVGDDPGPGIRAILNQHAEIRDAWYVYRSDCIRDLIERWLASYSVTATEAAPWK